MTEQVLGKRCFGVSWSATDPKCAGGLDPMWSNDDGSHDRPRCDYYTACGARKMAAAQEQRLVQIRMQAQQQQQAQVQAQPAAMQIVPAQQQAMQPMQPAQRAPMPAQVMPYAGPAPAMFNPMQVNPMQMLAQAPIQLPVQQMMPVNFFMPGYLSVPEQQLTPGFGGYMSMLGLSIMRAMFKAAGHTVANVLDTTPFGVPQPPK